MHIGLKGLAQKRNSYARQNGKPSRRRRQSSARVVIECMLRVALEILQEHKTHVFKKAKNW